MSHESGLRYQVKMCYNQDEANAFLAEADINGIVDIKLGSSTDTYDVIMITYTVDAELFGEVVYDDKTTQP